MQLQGISLFISPSRSNLLTNNSFPSIPATAPVLQRVASTHSEHRYARNRETLLELNEFLIANFLVRNNLFNKPTPLRASQTQLLCFECFFLQEILVTCHSRLKWSVDRGQEWTSPAAEIFTFSPPRLDFPNFQTHGTAKVERSQTLFTILQKKPRTYIRKPCAIG